MGDIQNETRDGGTQEGGQASTEGQCACADYTNRFQPIGSGMDVLYSVGGPRREARPPPKVSAPAQITQIDSNQ